MKVLLADDDRDFIDLLRYAFQRDGHTVLLAFDGEAALRLIQTESPQLLVLDLMMPKRSGIDVLRELPRYGDIPVIVLSALGDEEHLVEALELGADDYMVKPFRPRELRARVEAVLRRGRERVANEGLSSRPLQIGAITLDPRAHSVAVGGTAIPLTPREFSLLHYLMLNRDAVVRLGDIMANVWGYDADESEKVVKVAVARLRRKIEPDPAHPTYIVNVPGVGYKFQATD